MVAAARRAAPKGAPNVLLIMTDDDGFGAPGTFGGVIPTPALESHREERAALHEFPLHVALLADARGDLTHTHTHTHTHDNLTRRASEW